MLSMVNSNWSADTWSQIASHAAFMAEQLKELEMSKKLEGVEHTQLPFNFLGGAELLWPVAPISYDKPSDSIKTVNKGTNSSRSSKSVKGRRSRISQAELSLLHADEMKSGISNSRHAFGIQSISPTNVEKGRKSPEDSSCSADRIRQYDREKKRKTRNLTGDLIKHLESLLPPPKNGRPRTLHETLSEASALVRENVSPTTMRMGLIAQSQVGLILIDSKLSVLDSNTLANNLSGATLARGVSLNSVAELASDFIGDMDLVTQQLSRSKFRDESLGRFMLSFRSGDNQDSSGTESLGEVIKCSPLDSRLQFEGNGASSTKFMLFLHPLAPPTDPSACVQRALRAIAGFREGDTCVVFQQMCAPVSWGSRCRTSDMGGDMPPFGAAWALEFLHAGVKDGNWGGLKEWLESRPCQTSEHLRALAVMDALSESAGREEGKYCLTMEMRQEPGHMLCRVLLRGLCLFEFNMDAQGMYPSVPFPRHSQNFLVEGALSLEEQCLRKVAAGGRPNELRVLADGSVWFCYRPNRQDLLEVLRPASDQGGAAPTAAPAAAGSGGALPRTQVNVLIARDPDRSMAVRKYKMIGNEIDGCVRRWVPAQQRAPEVGGVDVRNALLNLFHEMRFEAAAAPCGADHTDAPAGRALRPAGEEAAAVTSNLSPIASGAAAADGGAAGGGCGWEGLDGDEEEVLQLGSQPLEEMESWDWAPLNPFDNIFNVF